MVIRTTLLAAIASVGMATAAYAVPVTGQISLNGYAEATGSTGIEFADGTGTSVTSGTLSSFGAGTGAFAALGTCTGGSCGTIKDIASFTANAPISSFLTLNIGSSTTVSFDLTSLTSVGHDTADNSVSLKAVGIINFTDYDATDGMFYLTAQGSNLTSFSATTLVAPRSVPEPMSIAILGGSLAALGLLRRRGLKLSVQKARRDTAGLFCGSVPDFHRLSRTRIA